MSVELNFSGILKHGRPPEKSGIIRFDQRL